MPHLILEYSANIIEKPQIQNFLLEYHSLLTHTLPTQMNSCKSRALEYNLYCVGEGMPANAFVHLAVKVLSGRSFDKLNQAGKELLEKMQQQFAESLNQLNLEITLEIMELAKTYFKFEK